MQVREEHVEQFAGDVGLSGACRVLEQLHAGEERVARCERDARTNARERVEDERDKDKDS